MASFSSFSPSGAFDSAWHTEEHPSVPIPEIYHHPIPANFMDRDAVKVISRLKQAGHAAYLVGGGVRDLLLGHHPKDFDVATSARPEEVRALFRNSRIIGRRFRLVHVFFFGGKVIEVATFRRDPTETLHDGDEDFVTTDEPDEVPMPRVHHEEEARDLLIRNDNVFGEPHEDALRRDFTINGLFYDVERSEVLDYVGGLPDIQARVVRTIGNPYVRFQEDPVRMLRALKFSARLDLGLDPNVVDAAVALRNELGRAARARVFEEVLRLLRGGAATRSFHLAWEFGFLNILIPELAHVLDDYAADFEPFWRRLLEIDGSYTEDQLPSDAVLLLLLLYGPIQETTQVSKEPLRAFSDFFQPLSQRLLVPRRLKERMRSIWIAQRHLKRGRAARLRRHDFYEDAVTFYEMCAV